MTRCGGEYIIDCLLACLVDISKSKPTCTHWTHRFSLPLHLDILPLPGPTIPLHSSPCLSSGKTNIAGWKIPIFNRENIFKKVHVPASHVGLLEGTPLLAKESYQFIGALAIYRELPRSTNPNWHLHSLHRPRWLPYKKEWVGSNPPNLNLQACHEPTSWKGKIQGVSRETWGSETEIFGDHPLLAVEPFENLSSTLHPQKKQKTTPYSKPPTSENKPFLFPPFFLESKALRNKKKHNKSSASKGPVHLPAARQRRHPWRSSVARPPAAAAQPRSCLHDRSRDVHPRWRHDHHRSPPQKRNP